MREKRNKQLFALPLYNISNNKLIIKNIAEKLFRNIFWSKRIAL